MSNGLPQSPDDAIAQGWTEVTVDALREKGFDMDSPELQQVAPGPLCRRGPCQNGVEYVCFTTITGCNHCFLRACWWIP